MMNSIFCYQQAAEEFSNMAEIRPQALKRQRFLTRVRTHKRERDANPEFGSHPF
jgi:hypothetical protein